MRIWDKDFFTGFTIIYKFTCHLISDMPVFPGSINEMGFRNPE